MHINDHHQKKQTSAPASKVAYKDSTEIYCQLQKTQDHFHDKAFLCGRYLHETRKFLGSEVDACLPLSGFTRSADNIIVQEVVKRLLFNNNIIHILELAAGRTFPETKDVGSPWLSRMLSCAFPQRMMVTVSDCEDGLNASVESVLFGLDVISNLSIDDLSKVKKEFDLIYIRHLPPESPALIHLDPPAANLLQLINEDGKLIFDIDGKETIEIQRSSAYVFENEALIREPNRIK